MGKIYTRLGTKSQKELDTLAINDCKKDGGIDCLVRFRSLKKIRTTIDMLNMTLLINL